MSIELKELKNYVSLTQGLAINEGSAHLVSSSKSDDFSLPLLRIADMMENKYEKYISKEVQRNVIATPSDIIYTRTGQIGLVFTGKYGVVHNNSFIVKIINDDLLPNYLIAILQSDFVRKQALSFAHNSVQPDLTHDMFKAIKIPIPSKPEQEKFANLYHCFMAKIDKNNAINNNLLQMIDTVYQEFVYSNRALKSKFKVQNMFQNDLFTLIKSGVKHFNTKTYYATSEVNGINISNGWTITYEDRESRANMTPSLYSVWFAKMKNSIKHLFLNSEMQMFIDNSILSTGFYGLQCTELSFEYIASVIHNTNFEKLKDILSHGATQQGIGDDDLKNIKLLVPTEELLREYHQKTAPLFSLIAKNINENNSLIRLRDYLLPLLMNGQVIVD